MIFRRFDHCDGDPGPATASLDDHQHSRRELPLKDRRKAAWCRPRGQEGAEARSFLGLGLRYAQSAPEDGAGSTPSEPRRPFMRFRGGEFSTGTMRNFQPELTQIAF